MIDYKELKERIDALQKGYWIVPENIDLSNFDFDWRPNPTDRPYIHQFGTQWQKTGGPKFVVPGSEGVKYQDCQRVVRLPDKSKFKVLVNSDIEFDYSWHPDDTEPDFIYVFGNQYLDAEEMPTLEYITSENAQKKYIHDVKAKLVSKKEHWVINKTIDLEKFDLSWYPHPYEPPYIYVWGNQYISAEEMPTVEYHMPGAKDRKYVNDVKAKLISDENNWVINDKNIFPMQLDMKWVPHPYDPPYIYAWGNKWVPAELKPTIEYRSPGATEYKYMTNDIQLLPEENRWQILKNINMDSFDFTWRPDPREPAFIYVWGNQYLSSEEMPTVEYHMPGATDRKYMHDRVAHLANNDEYWVYHDDIVKISFDFNWAPHPYDPPYIYAWGNKWVPAESKPTLEYHVPGATEYKYMPELVEVQPQWTKWGIYEKVKNFDFSWRPDPSEPPFVYSWGNKWVSAEVKSTIEYYTDGATQIKYVNNDVELDVEDDKWNIILEIDKSSFDFTWRPDPTSPPYIYVWGNQWNNAEVEPTIEYHVPGAIDRKYMPEKIQVLPSDNWVINIPVDDGSFDFTWRPDPTSPPYIYVWGNQWNRAEVETTIEYHVPGATEYKYMKDFIAVSEISDKNWKKLISNIEFDFTWRPDPKSPPYIYVWGNQHNDAVKEPTVEYHVPGATDRKYMNETFAKVLPSKKNWKKIISNVDFDFSWRPDPTSPPYIYVWGNQWNRAEIEPTVEYHVPGATDRKYMNETFAIVPKNKNNFRVLIEGAEMDFSWRPDPTSPPYIYVFGNKWNSSEVEPTILYVVPGATDRKYMHNMVARLKHTKRYWQVNRKEDLDTFDFSWRPNPHSPPQIYQWEDNGPTYKLPNATAVVFMKRDIAYNAETVPRYTIKTTLEDLIKEHENEVFWALNPDLNYEKFDFNWKPDETNFTHVNVFGNEFSKDTQTYYINGPMYRLGYNVINYVETQSSYIDTNLSMFYVDTGNSDCSERFEKLKDRYPQLQKTRFLNSWVETINRCGKKSETKLLWVLSSDYDYSDFKFDFYPGSWQMEMTHVFGSQYSHWGNTYLINKESFAQDTKYVKIIEHLKNINHVRGKKAKTYACKHDILYITFGNNDDGDNLAALSKTSRKIYEVTYDQSYVNTIKNFIQANPILETKQNYFIWITNSICDYSNFDFSFQHDPYQSDQVHVFSSYLNKSRTKFGDTFLINLHEFNKNSQGLCDLERYANKVNYIEYLPVPRKPHPVIKHDYDSHVDAIKNLNVDYFPYYELLSKDTIEYKTNIISLWDSKKHTVVIGSKGATGITVPHVAIKSIKNEVYDYPYIDNAKNMLESNPLDIVFISNGEPSADENYEILVSSLKKRNIPNRLTRVKNINGRVASQHAAACLSETKWYFLVNGKVKVNDSFDWLWQPDRLQQPKHYIFTVTNPVNGLIYGHQAIVANNRNLTLNTVMKGLDFTLDSLHEVVDMNCGTAIYNTDPWTTWRTAFRESIKLSNNNDAISKYRLERWTSYGTGNYCEMSQRGALDGIEYYESVNGDMDKLLLSYDWEWIRSYYNSKYGK